MQHIFGTIAGIVLFLWLVGSCTNSCEERRETKYYEAQRELQEKQKHEEDSLREVKRVSDSIYLVEKRVELSKTYGKTLVAIENKLKTIENCHYTGEGLENFCKWSKTYGLQVILDEISYNGVRNSSNEKNIAKRANFQKKYGRNRANKVIDFCTFAGWAGTNWDRAETICNHRVQIGFTKQMCELAWGRPQSINRTTSSWGTHEQWCYPNYNYLYFEDNVLTSIQN